MRSIKVLYITYDGLTDPLGQSQILPYLIELRKKGYQITIVSFEKTRYNSNINQIRTVVDSHNIHWFPMSYTKQPPVLSTLWDLFRLSRKVYELHAKNSYDFLHCRSYIPALIGLRMRRKKGIPFLFDMRGFWADERVDGLLWNLKNPIFNRIYLFFKLKEKQFLHEAEHIISLTHSGEDKIVKHLVRNPAPISVIPCCVDTELFNPERTSTKKLNRQSLDIAHEAFVLGYIGSIGTWYMLSEMVDFFKELINLKTEAIFLFITREAPEVIESAFHEARIPLKHLRVRSGLRQEMPAYISMFDWSIFFIKPVFSKQASSPTKQGELMSMGVPIVCNANIGDTDKIVKKYKSGLLIEHFDSTNYQSTIKMMEIFKLNRYLLRQGAIEYFSLMKGVNTYDEVYQAICQ